MRYQPNTFPVNQVVTVKTSARLHMGFYDLTVGINGVTHQFGSLGLAIDAPTTIITLTKSEQLRFDISCNEHVIQIVNRLIHALNIKPHFSLSINTEIPAHIGLGSGTQLALAIGTGLNQLFNLQLSVAQIALAAQRGKRSGIGIATFERGGFLVDDKTDSAVPQIVVRQDCPSDWCVLLINDSAHIGVHGALELAAFAKLKPTQNSLRDMVFKHMMPALQRADLLAFGAYMQDLQAYNGAYFAPIQGGHFASKDVADVMAWLQQNGAACVGQSSWGPTGFAILQNQQQADALQHQAQLAFADRSNISFQIVRGNNAGATII